MYILSVSLYNIRGGPEDPAGFRDLPGLRVEPALMEMTG